ncbi:CAP domain-containing protein [Sporosarcina sp. YIM B06819]|uniref:CAP domain-containing protein n=1 Tax=Sporosarcina sp. YIM B06819 TaxID=3081769 RepID=UPI00298CF64F|nr:CAP-associated domain-containing protein [Sporosarcina sp. YIM B06819]
MKVLWKIALLLVIVLAFFYITDDRVKENKPLESPVKHGTAIPVPGKGEGLPIAQARPEVGISLFVGQSVDKLIAEIGKPDRIEPSDYGYDWWIYTANAQFMVGVKDDVVNQIYTADVSADVAPFTIGQLAQDIYRFTIVETEVAAQVDDSIYTFTLNGDDAKTRLLIEYEGVYAQLYIDSVDEVLEAVRFINPVTLVLHQPYDMSYMGEIVSPHHPSSTMQIEVDRAVERQIFELTNVYRKKHGVDEVFSDYHLGEVARKHSEDMVRENYFSHESPVTGNLADRLKEAKIEHRKAGENIASNYVDAIEAVHGWLNSPAHRNVLLDKDFTHLGTGAYGKFYTQNFVRLLVEEQGQR